MSKQFEELNSLGCIDELERRLNQIQGILITLEVAMESKNGFITIQPTAKHAVTAATNMTEEAAVLSQHLFKMLPRNK